ncbi:aminoglycoside phosphotransferase [Longimycelium tulufanense]|uniref:Aminoglycoside phosphotransferase n=1 Tax=Longimycelium tulufanense TaxID=907463 RepID=A0A8J3C6D9_9PSEU|nr:aminoglycoside phosphotransferase [Longimycelium tulufanense]
MVRVDDVVVKAHRNGTDAAILAARLRIATYLEAQRILLQPVRSREGRLLFEVEDRLVTIWPAGEPVRPDDVDAVPWEHAAHLLARLHTIPTRGRDVAGPLPPAGAPHRVARGVAGLGDGSASAEIRRAFATLPAWTYSAGDTPAGSGSVVHGDWHLGQLVWHGTARETPGWRLIDVDDLGIGAPAWDLARPAAWFAAGLLPPRDWGRLLTAYRAARGPAVPPEGDPWPALDAPARAFTVQSAAVAVARAREAGRPLDDVAIALVDACRRIANVALRPCGYGDQ